MVATNDDILLELQKLNARFDALYPTVTVDNSLNVIDSVEVALNNSKPVKEV